VCSSDLLLGVIFFEILTDRTPFESEDPTSLRLKQLSRTPKPPHMFRFDLPGELSQIVMSLLGRRPDERPFDVSVFKSALGQCVAGGMTVEEELEERPPLSRETDAPQSSPVETPEDLPEAREKYQASTGSVVMPVPDTPGLVEEESATAWDDDERARGGKIVVDLFEEPLSEAREQERGELTEASPVPFPRESSGARYRPLAWLLAVLLIGGGLFGTMRGGQFGGRVKNITSGAEQQINHEVAAPKADVFIPTPEPTPMEETGELSAKSEPAIQAVGDTPPGGREDRAVFTEKKEAGKDEAGKPSPGMSSETAPPTNSPVEPAVTPESAPPAEVKDIDLQDRQSPAPAPVPEPPVKAEAPAPRVIRRSGDVLQNTAVIRPRPTYPKAAREAKIKGSVTVELTIDEEGSVVAARPISGPEQLRDAAVAAARRWKWTPARVDRNRAGVVGTITFVFKD